MHSGLAAVLQSAAPSTSREPMASARARVTHVPRGAFFCSDLDQAAEINLPIGYCTSTGYMPPELARARYADSHSLLLAGETDGAPALDRARRSFDVWSFGVVLLEMCLGRTLFAQDTANDSLVDSADRTRLCTWLCAPAFLLEQVLQEANDVARPARLRPTPCIIRVYPSRPPIQSC